MRGSMKRPVSVFPSGLPQTMRCEQVIEGARANGRHRGRPLPSLVCLGPLGLFVMRMAILFEGGGGTEPCREWGKRALARSYPAAARLPQGLPATSDGGIRARASRAEPSTGDGLQAIASVLHSASRFRGARACWRTDTPGRATWRSHHRSVRLPRFHHTRRSPGGSASPGQCASREVQD